MRFIKYMKIINVAEGYYFLINGLNGYIDTIDEEGYRICNKWLNLDEIVPSNQIERNAYEFLISRNYLCDYQSDELIKQNYIEELKQNLHNQKDTLYLNLIVTYDCNFSCRYCYEQSLSSNGKEWVKKSMDVKMVQNIYDYIDREGYKLTRPGIYGGEPLLPKNKEVIEEILSQNAKRNKATSIVTNGFYLSDYLPLLKKYPISEIHVTIDGSRESHNIHRNLSPENSAYDRIVEGVISAVEAGLSVCVRSNIYIGQEQGVEEMLQYFHDRGLMKSENFSFYTNPVFEIEPGECQPLSEHLSPSYLNLHEKIKRFPRILNPLSRIHPLADTFMGKNKWIPKYIYCGAGINSLLIDPHGNVHPCKSLISRENQSVGYFDGQKIIYNQNMEIWKNRTIDKLKKCQNCWAIFICGGGCGKRAVEKLGNLALPECSEIGCLENDLLPYLFNKFVKPTL